MLENIVLKMKKIIVAGIVLIMMGVVFAGSGSSVVAFQPQKVMEGRNSGYISYGSASNASFLAPMPINYTMNQVFSPWYFLSFNAAYERMETE